MKAFLLAAGRGIRFRPVTDQIPKPLFPFLNVPLARIHLARLAAQGFREVGLNLHHLGGQIERNLSNLSAELPQPRFFRERNLLGTAGALRNALAFFGTESFLVVNCDAALDYDAAKLIDVHRKTGRAATLLVVENREPERYTPLKAEGDRITGFGAKSAWPLLYTGVCALDPELLDGIPEGETSLVTHVWEPLLRRGGEIGFLLHTRGFFDLGRPEDFVSASLEALARSGPFPEGSGRFDPDRRVLDAGAAGAFSARGCILAAATIGQDARLEQTVVWPDAEIGPGVRLTRCLAAGGWIPEGQAHSDCLLWKGADGVAAAYPFRSTSSRSAAHGVQLREPRRK